MKSVSIKEFKSAVDTMLDENYVGGACYLPLDKTLDGKTIALVIGWQDGYNDGEAYQIKTSDTTLTLCGKVAVNIDDLQYDYDFDWYMPSNKDGDVYDTNIALSGNYAEDLAWFLGEAEELIKGLDNKVLTI